MIVDMQGKLRFRVASSLVTLLLLVLCVDSLLASETVRIGFFSKEPVIFLTGSNIPAGIAVDVFTEIASENHWSLEWVQGTFAETLSKLKNDEIDIMVPLGYTEGRDADIDFSTIPLLQSWGCFFALAESSIQSIPDLEGKRIGYVRSSMFCEEFLLLLDDFNIQCEVVEFAGYSDLFTAIGDGTIDGGVGDRLNYFGLSQELAGVINSPIVFHPFGLFAAVQNGDPQGLLPAIEEYLQSGIQDTESELNRSINRWLHGSIEGETDTAAAFALLYGALVLAFLVYFLTRISPIRKMLGMSAAINQKAVRNVLLISVAAAVFLWIAESIIEFVFYNDAGISFGYIVVRGNHNLDLMHRFMYVASLLTGGMIVSQVLQRLKREQEEAQKVAENLSVTLQSIGDAIITTDINGKVTNLNRTASELTGWTKEESRGRPISELFNTFSIQTGERASNPVSSVLADGEIAGRTKHIKLISRDGSEYHIINSAAPIRTGSKTITGAILVFSDVTEEHKLETQLNQAMRMESIGRLAGGVAHDFNNMLNVILGYVDLIKIDMQGDESLMLRLNEIQNAAERSAELTHQLLAFARCQTVKPIVLDVNQVTESMLNMLRRLIGEDIDLIWEPADALMQIRIDPGQINQLLANLVVNSRDAIKGTGKITIRSEQAELDSFYCSTHPDTVPGIYVVLSVSDDGSGIDSKTRLQIFEPFFTTKAVGEGTGLGLSTVYGIVKQNGGFIDVYSEPGVGTVFRIYLPVIAEVGIGLTEEKNKTIKLSQENETILLVEDEISILSLGVEMLEKLGYNVLAAISPGDAIRLAKENSGKIDLLITDVVMPEMNGRILVEKLLASYPNLKYIYMSGYTAQIISHKGILEGGVNYISKPFTLSTLAFEVYRVLNQTEYSPGAASE